MTRRGKIKQIFLILSMLLLLAASTVSYAASGDLPESSIEKTNEALKLLAEDAFTAAFVPLAEELNGVNLTTYDNVAAQRDIFFRMASTLDQALQSIYAPGVGMACQNLRSMDIPLIGVLRGEKTIGWQQAAALYAAYGEEAGVMLARGLHFGLTAVEGGATFDCSFADNEAMFSRGTREQLLKAKFTLYYLNTVYNEQGVRKDYYTLALDPAYLDTLTHPLPGCMIKNGWYEPRSNGMRLHTGTDIRAARNDEILSVTDGVVLYIGFSRIPGNYVIIRDPSGYEYHYYHMAVKSTHVREGDIVKQGQVVGLVGSTGNSVANHLHLAIVTPENAYINPYDVFRQAGFRPIRPAA